MSQVVVFLMVLFITQTFRHERIMELAQQVANADLERSRQASPKANLLDAALLPTAAAGCGLIYEGMRL